ncbi:putative toxin-antitoxin system toxin component, PIN family [Burkholderia sp. AU19243]|uniref:putative toxin-antitoxin system toxin component, PIN family n=1 Tax=Burkholderia TaxID=32008 RepID=UPI000841D98F|nr:MULTISPECIES: putative toxin-antitoxin system toxin component, PIN family [Burkholderia]MBR8146435.1 putative toxin-antitoxin system toxin component, PIN family [Burkholderia vietnamiensis]AOK04906.1 nucleotide-binding protein [Burkholderia latens]MBR8366774.1 putative toxin-antitoxin system toxin component, PIN family [Burkholderia sp. AU19243]MCA8310373.1 putative toxin-antitoxin system toxin component, PIN family [Burkholderia sp. AU28942]QTO47509.1 putative toxin-antitoxin system toxin 
MTRSLAPHDALRVVLDSNVWIDILVFDDPATRPIRAALERGTLGAVIDGRCLNELELVLDYPQFRARAIDKAKALAIVARLATLVEPPAIAAADTLPLPKCKDRDDQKFLELARAAQADWLVSKDRALLKLAKRTARDFGFRIAQPAPFTEACALDAASATTSTPA